VGGNAEDKYGFVWSADNYNVIDLTYSAGTAIITPRQEGKAEVTISHPKSPYDTVIKVMVTEYSQFAFSQAAVTIPEGTTQFVSMQVPAIEGEYSGRVTYKTDNDKIVTITGTNKVSQITALATGTAIVTATSPSGAKSDLMVYVKKAAEMTVPYISSPTNVLAMKVTDAQRSVSASIVGEGITTPDQYNLQWSIVDPSIASLIGTSGANVIVKPLKAGETAIKIKHPKTDSVFTIHVQVEGSVMGISLNRSYIATETGKTQELTATIDLGTSENYKNIAWSSDKVNGTEIVSILGSGKTVAIYALTPGKTTVTAEYNGKTAKCDVQVSASRQFTFDTQTIRIQPGQTKTFKYTLVPSDAAINWITNTNEYVSYQVDTSSKTVTLTGITEGVTKLSGTANSMSASINITCAWDYKLSLNKTLIKSEPRYDATNPLQYIIGYEVHPADAQVNVLIDNDIATYTFDKTKREIYVRPTKEGTATLTVSAKNPYNNYQFGSQVCSLNFGYTSLTVVPSVISNGRFSRYDKASGVLVLGDGEDITLKLGVAQENATYTLSNIQYASASATPLPVVLSQPSSGIWTVSHTDDYIEKEYLVTDDTYFTWNGSRVLLNWQKKEHSGEHVYLALLGKKDIKSGTYNEITTSKDIYLSTFHASFPFKTIYDPCSREDEFGYVIDASNELAFNKIPLSSPKRLTREQFIANTDYYIPPMSYNVVDREGYSSWGTWHSTTYHDGTSPEYYLNNAQMVNSLDTSIVSTTTAGYISGVIVRGSGNQAFQIPVIVEKRKCAR
jgi:hypothetical protein